MYLHVSLGILRISWFFRCEIHVLGLLLLQHIINVSFRLRAYNLMWVDKGNGGKQKETF